jgi:hypothetical protein
MGRRCNNGAAFRIEKNGEVEKGEVVIASRESKNPPFRKMMVGV